MVRIIGHTPQGGITREVGVAKENVTTAPFDQIAQGLQQNAYTINKIQSEAQNREASVYVAEQINKNKVSSYEMGQEARNDPNVELDKYVDKSIERDRALWKQSYDNAPNDAARHKLRIAETRHTAKSTIKAIDWVSGEKVKRQLINYKDSVDNLGQISFSDPSRLGEVLDDVDRSVIEGISSTKVQALKDNSKADITLQTAYSVATNNPEDMTEFLKQEVVSANLNSKQKEQLRQMADTNFQRIAVAEQLDRVQAEYLEKDIAFNKFKEGDVPALTEMLHNKEIGQETYDWSLQHINLSDGKGKFNIYTYNSLLDAQRDLYSASDKTFDRYRLPDTLTYLNKVEEAALSGEITMTEYRKFANSTKLEALAKSIEKNDATFWNSNVVQYSIDAVDKIVKDNALPASQRSRLMLKMDKLIEQDKEVDWDSDPDTVLHRNGQEVTVEDLLTKYANMAYKGVTSLNVVPSRDTTKVDKKVQGGGKITIISVE